MNFVCKCLEKFNSFNQFKTHALKTHDCRDTSLSHTIRTWKTNSMTIKFYWYFQCKTKFCKDRKFTSTAITSIAQIDKINEKISISMGWSLSAHEPTI